MRGAAEARLTRGHAALGGLERMCSQIQFQEPRTKLWLFDTLVTSTLLYGVQIWGPSLDHSRRSGGTYDGWRSMERPLISMISRMIRAKASVPHEIIRAELAAPPIVVEALTCSVSFIHSTWELPRHRYARLALESSRQLASDGDTACWYAQMTSWFELHGFSIDRLPPFQYSLEAPLLSLTRPEISRIIRQDLIQLDTRRTWIDPPQELGTKMAFYRDHLLRTTEDGFIVRPGYMDTHLSHALRCAIGQIRTSSHQLEIETGRYRGIPPEERICQMCHTEPETEEHYICRCTVYYEIRGRFHCLFREGFGPLSRVMDFYDQRCVGFFLLEICRFRESLMRSRGSAHRGPVQRQMSHFYRGTSQESSQRAHQSSPRRGVLLDRAFQLGRSRRPRAHGFSVRRRRLHRRIQDIIARARDRVPPPRHFTSWEEIESIRRRPMREFLG
eukprot:c24426_g1_i1 orf=1306-2640(+)